MALDWNNLTSLTGNRSFVVSRVTLTETAVSIEGEFELPPLARLCYEDQVFVAEFVRAHGSIKHMEQAFGVSYPTVKNRLNAIAGRLQLIQVNHADSNGEILDQLERGEITAEEAAERMKK